MSHLIVEQLDPASSTGSKKRQRVAPNLYRRANDGRFEDIRVNPATGKQQLRTLRRGR
jgi:hypothetical protein